MDHVTLSQAVNSICPPQSPNLNYMNMDTDFLYMDQPTTSNLLESNITLSKEIDNETATSYKDTNNSDGPNDTTNGIGAAMNEYVNALKNAGLPTDLPILLESGDGSYINVNEQALIDMVQSNEIQYEVIEQPNIIEKVIDPSEIKSIDELSRSIERNEILMNSKSIPSSIFDKDSTTFLEHEEAINSLNSILPDNLESFSEQENFVVLNNNIQESDINNVNNSDFSSLVNDIFSKNISDDMKNYYDDSDKSKPVDQLCTTSGNLDSSFNMSFLDSKVSHFEPDSMVQDYNPIHTEDLRRNDDSYDFSLNLTQGNEFKDGDFDCLINSPNKLSNNNEDKCKSYEDNEMLKLHNSLQKDAPEYSSRLDTNNENVNMENTQSTSCPDLHKTMSQPVDFEHELDALKEIYTDKNNELLDYSTITSTLSWDSEGNFQKNAENDSSPSGNKETNEKVLKIENEVRETGTNNCNIQNINNDGVSSTSASEDHDIPLAVGLLPTQKSGNKRSFKDDEPNIAMKNVKRTGKSKKKFNVVN